MVYRDEQRTIEAGGHDLEARFLGPGPEEAPTLVFLHEGLGCVDLWRDFPRRLAEEMGWGALVYSRAGYGRSEPISLPRRLDYLEDEGSRVLPEIIHTTGLENYALIGHSDGGSIALVFAGASPSASPPGLMAVVTEAAHIFTEEKCVRAAEQAREGYSSGDLRRRLGLYHGDNVDCAFQGWNRAWLDPDFGQMNLEGYLPNVRVPCLIIQGEDDEYGTTAQVTRIEQGLAGPATSFLVPECGHSPHHEQADLVFERMSRFLRALDAPDPH